MKKLPTRTDLRGRPLPVSVRLKAQKVQQKTIDRYLMEIENFKTWLSDRRQKMQLSRLDSQVVRYLTFLAEETNDATPPVGSYLVFGLQLLHNTGSNAEFLPQAKAALAGWKRAKPGGNRHPVPEEFAFDLAVFFLEKDRLDLAMAVVLQQHCYLRPSELLGLTRAHVSFPAPGRYKRWALLLSPQELGERSKTHKTDESVLIGDVEGTEWIAQCFGRYVSRCDQILFPNITLAQYERFFTQAIRSLQYSISFSPHTMRHTGPSSDLFHKRRTLPDAQKRGRWMVKSSLRRYEQSALLVKAWEGVHPRRKTTVARLSQTFPAQLLQALR